MSHCLEILIFTNGKNYSNSALKKKINDGFYQIDLWETWEMNFLNL